MIATSNTTIRKQKDNVVDTHYSHCYLYKQYVGRIVTYGTGYVVVDGDAIYFIHVGDKVVVRDRKSTV